MRLIDADELLEECKEAQKSDPNADGRGWANYFLNAAGKPSTEWYCVEDMIEYAPIIDAAPVVHAEWLMNSDFPDRLICSKCGAQFDCWHWEAKQMKYCPNCGAKMDGGEKDESI